MKKKKAISVMLCAAAVSTSIFAFAGCGDGEGITISGSSSVTPLMESLAAEYEKSHDIRITINMSSSGDGIKDTQNGLNDFGMSSRDLKDSETGVHGETLCRDGIALIVNKDCAVTDVKKTDVKALFADGTAIPDTTITAGVGRNSGSGTRGAFDELLKIDEKVGYHSSVATQAETGNVIEVVQESVNSLGYISFGSLNDKVKAVSLDGVVCTLDNIKNGTYALQRPFVIVLKDGAELSDAAQGFYDYIMSSDAQSVITAKGYVSIK